MPRYKLIVAYDGTDFHGWQTQNRPDKPSLRTVQEVMQKAVIQVMREPVVIIGASRTDSGVHAKGQVASFSSTNEIKPDKLIMGINSWLPDDVQVRAIEIVEDGFNPINDCTCKGYQYTLAHGCSNPLRKPLFERRFMAHTAFELDAAVMNQAATLFEGEHDFAGFTKLNHGRESTVRRIDHCSVQSIGEGRIAIDVAGAGFLWNMVRIIAGTLLEVGRGRFVPEDIPEIIDTRERRSAGKTLPAHGLSLEWVSFD
jgi:tRNA pseudouridine38-40 synthase